jgi:hypothetical protein
LHDQSYEKALKDLSKTIPEKERTKPGNIFAINVMYMTLVGFELVERYEKRDSTIREWMARDEAKDNQLANARLTTEPKCQHCSKAGLRIIDKTFMHRGEDYKYDDPEEVLFTLSCPHCDKNTAVWEDGSKWEHHHTRCPECTAIMESKSARRGKLITTTYTCPNCSHTYKDKLDLNSKEEEKPDPDYEADRRHYCLEDEKHKKQLMDMARDLKAMAELGKEFKEKQDNKHIYDAVKEMKKPKIAELIPLLSQPLKKAGYIEFHLDKPEMGRDVYVGFSCLDSKSDREDYDSRKTLKKLVDKTLESTNWRLMSDGISYRLGYLNGRVRAYEAEEDLKNLVMKSKSLKKKQTSSKATDESDGRTLKAPDGTEIIL